MAHVESSRRVTPERNREVGSSVKAARDSAGVSQKELADKMRGVGFKWSQATVWSIERGERPLTWSEGLELGQMIGFSLPAKADALIADALAYRKMAAVVNGRESGTADEVDP